MLEALLVISGLLILAILFYPRPSTRRRYRRDDKPYWMDKRGY